jgi:hypothetical protein
VDYVDNSVDYAPADGPVPIGDTPPIDVNPATGEVIPPVEGDPTAGFFPD